MDHMLLARIMSRKTHSRARALPPPPHLTLVTRKKAKADRCSYAYSLSVQPFKCQCLAPIKTTRPRWRGGHCSLSRAVRFARGVSIYTQVNFPTQSSNWPLADLPCLTPRSQGLLVDCLTSQQHASVSQRRICPIVRAATLR